MIDVLTTLQLVDLKDVCLHEAHEESRLLETSRAIEKDGMLRHPPLAVRMRDGRYLIIDGAHRTGALRVLGCVKVPLQVVEESDFTLEAWFHAVPVGEWQEAVRRDPSLRLTELRESEQPLAEMVEADGSLTYIYAASSSQSEHSQSSHMQSSSSRSARLHAWQKLVAAYTTAHAVNRIAPTRPHVVQPSTVLMRYPACTLQDLEEAVLAGDVMPAGVTRFTVAGRLLNLCIPLEVLHEASFEAERWERLLDRWAGSLRLYSEAVYFCEAT